MSKKLDDALYQFADNGTDRKDEVLANVIQKAKLPVNSKIHYRKYIIAAVSFCLVITIIGNFNVIASSVNKLINTFFPSENIMMNEVNINRLQELHDARIAETAVIPNKDSIEYQLVYGIFEPVETPCYVYVHYYRGYRKTITLDKKTKNIKEVEEWLRNNAGIVARVAGTPEEAAQLFNKGSVVTITPEKLRTAMGDGFTFPDYLPDSGDIIDDIIQYNEGLSSGSITYSYKIKADFDTSSRVNDYIVVNFTKVDTKYSESLMENLAITKAIETEQINGHDVYIADAYYVWKNNGFVYVMYSTFTTHEEAVKIIENMK